MRAPWGTVRCSLVSGRPRPGEPASVLVPTRIGAWNKVWHERRGVRMLPVGPSPAQLIVRWPTNPAAVTATDAERTAMHTPSRRATQTTQRWTPCTTRPSLCVPCATRHPTPACCLAMMASVSAAYWALRPDAQRRRGQQATAAAGYEQYEPSSFARPGARSVHNSSYWHGLDYVGAAFSPAGAHHVAHADGRRFLAARGRRRSRHRAGRPRSLYSCRAAEGARATDPGRAMACAFPPTVSGALPLRRRRPS